MPSRFMLAAIGSPQGFIVATSMKPAGTLCMPYGPPCCSRICNGQSTKDPQRPTRPDAQAVCFFIKITYFHSISIDFHKQCDLLGAEGRQFESDRPDQ
jgi:hypothetical protein